MPLKILMQVQSLWPQKANNGAKAHHTPYTSRSRRLAYLFFAQLTLFPNPQNTMLYNAFSQPDTPKTAPSHGGIYIPM